MGYKYEIKKICNICGNDELIEYNNKPHEVCTKCHGRARHRIAHVVYSNFLKPLADKNVTKVLHLAPEKSLYPLLKDLFGAGYMPADANPTKYTHTKVLKLFFPKDFEIFPEDYFDVILHNHVLEHIPGHYKNHMNSFFKILKPGGLMIFSVPGPYFNENTREGGEHLATDQERVEKFFQEDHFKIFGRDFVEFISQTSDGILIPDGITDEIRASCGVRPGKAPFFIWKKISGN